MSKTRKDPNQIQRDEHDEKSNAKRVILVGGEKLDIEVDSDNIINAIKDGMRSIEFPDNGAQLTEKVEYKTIEVPVVVPELKVVEIEKPVVVTKFETVEKPVIIKETEIQIVKENIIIRQDVYRIHPVYITLIALETIAIISGVLYFKGVI